MAIIDHQSTKSIPYLAERGHRGVLDIMSTDHRGVHQLMHVKAAAYEEFRMRMIEEANRSVKYETGQSTLYGLHFRQAAFALASLYFLYDWSFAVGFSEYNQSPESIREQHPFLYWLCHELYPQDEREQLKLPQPSRFSTPFDEMVSLYRLRILQSCNPKNFEGQASDPEEWLWNLRSISPEPGDDIPYTVMKCLCEQSYAAMASSSPLVSTGKGV